MITNFFEGYNHHYIHNVIVLNQPAPSIWREITNVMVAKFSFPIFFSALGIPKPLSAEIIKEGKGGYRRAHFSNDIHFEQEIVEWKLHKQYRFKFNPTKNFKVGHFMKLANGPFQILTGGYEITEENEKSILRLSSNYKLSGWLGKVMHLPFRMVVYYFQLFLLKSIQENLNQ